MIDETAKQWSDRKHFMWWPITFTKYRVENDRLFITTGLFTTKEEECLLYRIMDIGFERTFGNKIFGTGSIRITTRDASNPEVELKNIGNSAQVKRCLSQWIEDERIKKHVVGRDMYGAAGHIAEDMEEVDDQSLF